MLVPVPELGVLAGRAHDVDLRAAACADGVQVGQRARAHARVSVWRSRSQCQWRLGTVRVHTARGPESTTLHAHHAGRFGRTLETVWNSNVYEHPMRSLSARCEWCPPGVLYAPSADCGERRWTLHGGVGGRAIGCSGPLWRSLDRSHSARDRLQLCGVRWSRVHRRSIHGTRETEILR